jgi:arginyl-tRNA synthetase
MKEEIATAISDIATHLYGRNITAGIKIELTRPDEQFGDYATNMALQLAKPVGKSPREIAETIASELRVQAAHHVRDVAVAGPGFINLTLTDGALERQAIRQPAQIFAGQTVVTEYSDPNPFKVLHAGHLYTSIVGHTISSLIELAGGTVHRVNFGGDVGLHVGRTMWAILQELGGERPEKLAAIPENGRSEWMAQCYVTGTQAYEENEAAKNEIINLNKRVYQLFADNDHISSFAQIYWTCRQWSYDYFNAFYERIGTPFERYYPESETAPLGLSTVREQLQKGVYKQSDGAVVFEGEPYGLHTRVFINSNGLPTYEAKDVGLSLHKWQDYHYDRSIIITGNDIIEYMKVVLKSIEQFQPELARRTVHLTHGNVKLAGGIKMSSRKGNFLRAMDVLEVANVANTQANGAEDERAALGAVKYSFLKRHIGPDIIFDPKDSVSLEGNSGPYLQYAHARARSVLVKAGAAEGNALLTDLQSGERTLLRKLSEYSEILDRAVAELMPHHVCTYLYELAQTFNRFYEQNLVVGDPREAVRVRLVRQYADTLKTGLTLLGIEAPDRM